MNIQFSTSVETVNFEKLVLALKHWHINNIEFSPPASLIVNKNDIIQVDGIFLKTHSWQHPFRSALEVLNVLWYERIIPIDQLTKNRILFRYDLECFTLEKALFWNPKDDEDEQQN